MSQNINGFGGGFRQMAGLWAQRANAAPQSGFKDAPVVNQLHPNGADASHYVNGTYNCAGAVAATLARMLGTHSNQSDADLIDDLSDGRTTKAGTTPSALMDMIGDVGGKVDGAPTVGAYKDKDLDALLAKGDKVVAQVGVRNASTGKVDAHYVIVDGKDAGGNYRVKDPLKGEYAVTPDQLRTAVYKAPGAGGMLIPVAPANQPAAKVPANAAGKGPTPTAALTTDAFETDNNRIQGVDTTWKPYYTDGFDHHGNNFQGDERVDNNRFDQQVEASKAPVKTDTQPKAVNNTSPQDYANLVLGKLGSDDLSVKAEGQQMLDGLSQSDNSADRQAFKIIVDQIGRQGGIGQRVGYSGYGGGA